MIDRMQWQIQDKQNDWQDAVADPGQTEWLTGCSGRSRTNGMIDRMQWQIQDKRNDWQDAVTDPGQMKWLTGCSDWSRANEMIDRMQWRIQDLQTGGAKVERHRRDDWGAQGTDGGGVWEGVSPSPLLHWEKGLGRDNAPSLYFFILDLRKLNSSRDVAPDSQSSECLWKSKETWGWCKTVEVLQHNALSSWWRCSSLAR